MGEAVATAGSSQDERRQHFRVQTRLRFSERLVHRHERPVLEEQILGRPSDGPSALAPELAAWLERIERKLDVVLQVVAPESSLTEQPLEPRDLSLSGSGVAFESDLDLDVGDELWLEIELPGPPSYRVCCLATVVSIGDPCPDWRVAACFRAIREEDRDRIISHTLAVERESLRARRSAW